MVDVAKWLRRCVVAAVFASSILVIHPVEKSSCTFPETMS